MGGGESLVEACLSTFFSKCILIIIQLTMKLFLQMYAALFIFKIFCIYIYMYFFFMHLFLFIFTFYLFRNCVCYDLENVLDNGDLLYSAEMFHILKMLNSVHHCALHFITGCKYCTSLHSVF